MVKKKKTKRRKSKKSKKKKSWKLHLALFSSLVLLGLGATWYISSHNVKITVSDKKTLAESMNNNTETFISQIASSAQSLGSQYDLYPSVMIAQATLESSSGTSGLASNYYNLFGIKGKYNGNSVSLLTWEDDGNGNAYNIYDDFRVYPSWSASLEDYANVLQQSHFSGVRRSNTTSYLDSTAALTGTYATDTSYGSKLNYIINTYNLTQYDGGSYTTPEQSVSGTVWNPYRGSYTSQDILDEDTEWANRK